MHRTLCMARARLRSVLVAYTARAESSMHHKWKKNMFQESAKYLLNLKFSHPILRTFLDKIFLFDHLKTSSFYSKSYFCELRSYPNAQNSNQKIYSTLHPYYNSALCTRFTRSVYAQVMCTSRS